MGTKATPRIYVTATDPKLVIEKKNVRSLMDGRRRVDYYVYAYFYNGSEYRRGIEVPAGSPPPTPDESITVLK